MNRKEYLNRFNRFQQSREQHFAPKINRALKDQYLTFTTAIKQGRPFDLALLEISSQGIIDVLKPLYIDAGIVYGAKIRADLNRVKARMAIGFNERMVQLMNDYFGTDILNESERITLKTRELIQRILIQANEEGRGIDWIVEALENSSLSAIRARVIARTETVTAANQGALFAAQDTGLVLNKEWMSVGDNRTRHSHRIVDGQIVGMDDYFSLPEGVRMKVPGDRGGTEGRLPTPAKDIVNCRCTTGFIPVRDRRGRLLGTG